MVGKFGLEGQLRHCELRQNLLLIITNKDNTDYFTFLVLRQGQSSNQPLVTNRVTYEKGKGDLYRLYNLNTSETPQYLDKKKSCEVSEAEIDSITDDTSSLLYILNKTKEKIEVVKLEHSKLLQSPFS